MRVLRFEYIAEEFPALVREWGLPEIALPHSNSSRNARRIPTEKQRTKGNAFVQEFYAEDFSRHGYDSRLPVAVAMPDTRIRSDAHAVHE